MTLTITPHCNPNHSPIPIPHLYLAFRNSAFYKSHFLRLCYGDTAGISPTTKLKTAHVRILLSLLTYLVRTFTLISILVVLLTTFAFKQPQSAQKLDPKITQSYCENKKRQEYLSKNNSLTTQ